MANAPQRDALALISDVSATVFAGRLPKTVDLSEIYNLAAQPSPGLSLKVVRLVPSRATYLFIEYESSSHASSAAEALNGYNLNGARIVVMPATQLRRLFIGNIARDCPAGVVHDAIASLEEGVTSVELFEDTGDGGGSLIPALSGPAGGPVFHRGFCFAEFRDHNSAHRALQKLQASGSSLIPADYDGGDIKVDWAEPLHVVPECVMSIVKVLYVSNLPNSEASEPNLHAIFSRYGYVERVRRLKNFAFIHFRVREAAERAMAELQNLVLGGHPIKIQWSKPPPKPTGGAIAAGVLPVSALLPQQPQQTGQVGQQTGVGGLQVGVGYGNNTPSSSTGGSPQHSTHSTHSHSQSHGMKVIMSGTRTLVVPASDSPVPDMYPPHGEFGWDSRYGPPLPADPSYTYIQQQQQQQFDPRFRAASTVSMRSASSGAYSGYPGYYDPYMGGFATRSSRGFSDPPPRRTSDFDYPGRAPVPHPHHYAGYARGPVGFDAAPPMMPPMRRDVYDAYEYARGDYSEYGRADYGHGAPLTHEPPELLAQRSLQALSLQGGGGEPPGMPERSRTNSNASNNSHRSQPHVSARLLPTVSEDLPSQLTGEEAGGSLGLNRPSGEPPGGFGLPGSHLWMDGLDTSGILNRPRRALTAPAVPLTIAERLGIHHNGHSAPVPRPVATSTHPSDRLFPAVMQESGAFSPESHYRTMGAAPGLPRLEGFPALEGSMFGTAFSPLEPSAPLPYESAFGSGGALSLSSSTQGFPASGGTHAPSLSLQSDFVNSTGSMQ